MTRVTSLVALVAGWGMTVAATPMPSARIAQGIVQGKQDDDVVAFLGIPYAAPPMGAHRWQAPLPAAGWSGARVADHFAPPCMQAPGQGDRAVPASEDCLYLNVWRPANARPGARLPVLVWIHGGAFRAGSTADPRIAGDLLARRGIVVVTIQYRVGVFGFLSHPELSAEVPDHVSGNYGLLDQIAALQWVKRNVAAFGGDPAKVTIGGLSAGAISTTMLAGSPRATGLFRGIISMSGGSFAPPRSPAEAGENMEPLAEAEHNGVRFAQGLVAADIAALRALPAARILAADSRGVAWPVIDGKVIPGDEYVLYGRRRMADVPLLLGTTADEGFNFSRVRSLADYQAEVARRYGSFAAEVLRAYPAKDDAQAIRQGRDLTRDVMFGWGTWAWATLQARFGTAPAFAYYFSHVAPHDAGIPPDAGATHGSDQPYPFGIAHQPQRAWTPVDATISSAMLGYFANFVTRGNPNGAGLPVWPKIGAAPVQVLRIGDTIEAGPVANLATIGVIDRYMAIRRDQGGLGAPK